MWKSSHRSRVNLSSGNLSMMIVVDFFFVYICPKIHNKQSLVLWWTQTIMNTCKSTLRCGGMVFRSGGSYCCHNLHDKSRCVCGHEHVTLCFSVSLSLSVLKLIWLRVIECLLLLLWCVYSFKTECLFSYSFNVGDPFLCTQRWMAARMSVWAFCSM